MGGGGGGYMRYMDYPNITSIQYPRVLTDYIVGNMDLTKKQV